jgi:hypothetical protein
MIIVKRADKDGLRAMLKIRIQTEEMKKPSADTESVLKN